LLGLSGIARALVKLLTIDFQIKHFQYASGSIAFNEICELCVDIYWCIYDTDIWI